MNPILETALKYVGFPSVKYESRVLGNSPDGFDCSGFIQYVSEEVGYEIPIIPDTKHKARRCFELFDFFGEEVELGEPGDLVFFSRNGVIPTHVGFLGEDYTMIHSPGKKGLKVKIVSLYKFLRKNTVKYDPEKFRGYSQKYYQNPIGYKKIRIPELEITKKV